LIHFYKRSKDFGLVYIFKTTTTTTNKKCVVAS